jgi:hypothetical protein
MLALGEEEVVDILQQGEGALGLGLRSSKGLSMERVLALVPVGEELELALVLALGLVLGLDRASSLERVLVIHTLLQILDTKRSQNIDPRLYHLL